jgi:hypothetical protein
MPPTNADAAHMKSSGFFKDLVEDDEEPKFTDKFLIRPQIVLKGAVKLERSEIFSTYESYDNIANLDWDEYRHREEKAVRDRLDRLGETDIEADHITSSAYVVSGRRVTDKFRKTIDDSHDWDDLCEEIASIQDKAAVSIAGKEPTKITLHYSTTYVKRKMPVRKSTNVASGQPVTPKKIGVSSSILPATTSHYTNNFVGCE